MQTICPIPYRLDLVSINRVTETFHGDCIASLHGD